MTNIIEALKKIESLCEIAKEFSGAAENALHIAHETREALEKQTPIPERAIDIPMDDCNFWINCGRDGTWLHFDASTGKSASINAEILAERQGTIIGNALADWCNDRQKQAQQIRVDNGQSGVGA